MILKTIDKFNDLVVSVYVTADHILNISKPIHFLHFIIHTRFMLLYGSRSDDGIKSFFQEVHELYIKSLLNPLYLPVPALHHHISIQKLVLLQENISRQAIFSVQELDIELNINS
ncbi:hypothetical protein Gogos_013728 [Gossypium gossypioides]|uniref:Trafficking protein particle complex subunit n=1 Tax=Gossypium gossypioides TaxID=34282 RepID=A0A7J9BWG1_GOSGO|nr:hypothetical protein [Gossypium gossypioides]